MNGYEFSRHLFPNKVLIDYIQPVVIVLKNNQGGNRSDIFTNTKYSPNTSVLCHLICPTQTEYAPALL